MKNKTINYILLTAKYITALCFAYYLDNIIFNIAVLVLTILVGVIIGIEAHLYIIEKKLKKLSKDRREIYEEVLRSINEMNKNTNID